VIFTRRPPAALSSLETLRQFIGSYSTPSGGKFEVVIRPGNVLAIQNADGTFQDLIPWQTNRFRIKEFPDVSYEFRLVDGRAMELRQSTPSGEFTFTRK
jgi:hypothetical protein